MINTESLKIEKADPSFLYEIKRKSWDLKTAFDKTEEGWLSVKGVLNSITKPFDMQKTAELCYRKGVIDPTYKYAGMSVEEIIALWNTKRDKSATRGIGLDEYIQSVLNDTPKPVIEDQVLRKKCNVFDRFVEEIIVQTGIKLVGTEIWLNSERYGVRGRIDALFEWEGKLLIFDWKNSENISYDGYNFLTGPAHTIKDTTINQYTLQTFIYMYILSKEYEMNVAGTRIVQLAQEKFTIHKPSVTYSDDLLESILLHARKHHNELKHAVNIQTT